MPSPAFRHRGDFEIHRSYLFRCEIVGFEFLSSRVESITPTFSGQESVGIHLAGSKDYHPEFIDIAGFDIVFTEDVEGSVITAIQGWKNLIQNSDGTFNYPDEYKRTVRVDVMRPDHSRARSMRYVGVFPTQTGMPSYSYADSSKAEITQSFSVDGVQVLDGEPRKLPSNTITGVQDRVVNVLGDFARYF